MTEERVYYFCNAEGLVAFDFGDGSTTFLSPSNTDSYEWRDYQAWLEAGNCTVPYTPAIGKTQDLAEAKVLATSSVRATAYSLLQPTDWVVVREMESGVTAPADITAYRTAVRAAADEKVATIEGKQKLETLSTYLRSDEFAAWPDAPSA